MNTIAVWHNELNKQTQQEEVVTNIDNDVSGDLHINVWKLVPDKGKDAEKNTKYVVDIGIMIYNYKNINELSILYPFVLFDDEQAFELNDDTDLKDNLYNKYKVIDLYQTLIADNDKTIKLIFNKDYVTKPAKNASIHLFENIVDTKDNFYLRKVTKAHLAYKNFSSKACKLVIKLNELFDSSDNASKNCYFRFRINCDYNKNLFDHQVSPYQEFQNYFVDYELIDFRVNDLRTYESITNLNNDISKNSILNLKRIDFLIMRDYCDDIDDFGTVYKPRIFEKDSWSHYLNNLDKYRKLMVYHFKEKPTFDNKLITEAAFLAKFKLQKSTRAVILKSLTLGIILAMASNVIYDLFKWIFSLLCCVIFGGNNA